MAKENKSPFVAKIDPQLANKMIEDLREQGFEITKPVYTIFNANKKGVSCTLYESGKLVVQGKDIESFLEFYLEPEILKEFSFSYAEEGLDESPRIGVDESGKGDFFGPLCVAAVFAKGEDVRQLKSLGVKDSKGLSDAKILDIGKKIQKHFLHHIVRINPLKYNEIYGQFKNLNRLLAWGHATVIETLVEQSGCQNVIIDQFAAEHVVKQALARKKIELNLSQRHRAEEDLVVAAASILARLAFLEGLDKLSKEFELEFPKGASALVIKVGKQFVKKYGKDALLKVGKLHFKTLDAILGEMEDNS